MSFEIALGTESRRPGSAGRPSAPDPQQTPVLYRAPVFVEAHSVPARNELDKLLDLNHVYFEKRSFSSSGSRMSLTQRRSAMTKGSRFRRTSKSATRRVRSSALAWQW